MVRQRRIRLCREGFYYAVVFLAVLIGAVSRQLNLLMLLGCALGGPLLFSFIYGRLALHRLTVDRKLPAHLHAGQPVRVDVSVANLRRWLGVWAIRVDDAVDRDGANAEEQSTVSVFFPRIAARESRHASYGGLLPRRGRYRFGPLRVSTRFPMGLVRHSVVLDEHAELVVHPQLGKLSEGWTQMMREYEAGSQRLTRRGLLEADFYGLREWRTGDSPRWIHWRTSARQGSLVVRQFEQRLSQNLALLVDLWQSDDPSDAQLERVETAVSFVATLIAEACRRPGARLMLEMAAAEWLSRSGPASPLFFREQMDALALVSAHSDAEFPDALGHALARVPAATPTLLVSTRPIDWEAFRLAAFARDTQLDGRKLQAIDVADGHLSQFFQPDSVELV
jgi:uncharacterized protein (DUF58 family)